MNKNFVVLFYVKGTKKNADGVSPIYLRITIDGSRVEISTKRHIEQRKWNRAAQKATGTNEEARSLNMYLKTLEQEVYNTHRELIETKVPLTAQNLKNKLLGISEKPFLLIEIFKEHNRQMALLVNKQYAPNTMRRYATVLRLLEEFLKWKYNVVDIDIKEIDHSFITALDFYLRSVRNCNNNSTCKYIKNFKKIILSCVAHGWLQKDPFKNYKAKLEEVQRDFLSKEELQELSEKKFAIPRLEHVKDIFLFCCFTGLSYVDVKKLRHSEISTGVDGEKWIFTNRQKTDATSRIPLLSIPLSIIDKYKEHPACSTKGYILPVLSNQKMNAYLQEIKEICGINKQLTCHIARHTFATTVTLSNGVPIETVSKMLGHKNIRTTQIYAKVLDNKVGDDMKMLRMKLEGALSVHALGN